jgi:pimeloyl-ACP methyl ester carboxylesterase
MKSNKKNIIILHGWGQNAILWQNIKTKFDNSDCNIIVEDLPGFGSRANQAIDFDIPKYAQWFEKHFSNILENQKIILIGHSLGGRIGIELAQNNPQWLEKIILIGTPGIYEPSTKIKFIKKLGFLKKLTLLSLISTNLNPEYESAKLNNLKETYQNIVNCDQKNILHLIQKPTLLIWGNEDKTVPISIAEQMNKLIPASKLKIMPNSGHSPQLDNPDLIFGIIKNFLDG